MNDVRPSPTYVLVAGKQGLPFSVYRPAGQGLVGLAGELWHMVGPCHVFTTAQNFPASPQTHIPTRTELTFELPLFCPRAKTNRRLST